jgi:Leucine-rich repeat (LRR) protein
MRSMEALCLRQTSVTTLAPIRALTQLKDLDLSDSPIDDAGLKAAAGFRNLDTLLLGHSAVTDAGMAHIAALPRLRLLFLERTRVGDAGLGLLCDLRGIHLLQLSETDLTDTGLAGVAEKLNRGPCISLDVSRSRITRAGLKSLSAKLTHTQLKSDQGFFLAPKVVTANQPSVGVDDASPR